VVVQAPAAAPTGLAVVVQAPAAAGAPGHPVVGVGFDMGEQDGVREWVISIILCTRDFTKLN
jgi:hypothetical protein